MDATIEQLILQELQEIRTDLKQFRTDTAERVSALEVKSKDISGNGQPGRMKLVEDAVDSLQRNKYWVMGVAAGVSGVLSAVMEFVHAKLAH